MVKKKQTKLTALDRIKMQSDTKLISLQRTSNVAYQNTDLPQWQELEIMYEQGKKELGHRRAIVSILNSIITQQRICFCFSRQQIMDLVANDPNWKKKSSFDPKEYSKVKGELLGNGFLREIYKGTGRKSSAYELIDPQWRSFLTINVEKQRAEAVAFAQKAAEETPNKTTQEVPGQLSSADFLAGQNTLNDMINESYADILNQLNAEDEPK